VRAGAKYKKHTEGEGRMATKVRLASPYVSLCGKITLFLKRLSDFADAQIQTKTQGRYGRAKEGQDYVSELLPTDTETLNDLCDVKPAHVERCFGRLLQNKMSNVRQKEERIESINDYFPEESDGFDLFEDESNREERIGQAAEDIYGEVESREHIQKGIDLFKDNQLDIQVIKFLAKGYEDRDIAKMIECPVYQVYNSVRRIKRKLLKSGIVKKLPNGNHGFV
jgi:hypothetical protein